MHVILSCIFFIRLNPLPRSVDTPLGHTIKIASSGIITVSQCVAGTYHILRDSDRLINEMDILAI